MCNITRKLLYLANCPLDGEPGCAQGPGNEATTELLERVNKSGKAFLVHTELSGRYVARMAIGGSLTQERHVRAAWQLISQCATEVLAARAQRKGI